MKILGKIVFNILLLLTFMHANAQVEVNVSGAKFSAKKIAVVPIAGDSTQKMDFIISSDLRKSASFLPIDPKTYPARPSSPEALNFADFQNTGSDYILLGRALNPDATQVQFFLFDASGRKLIANQTFQSRSSVHLAHLAADFVLKQLTGKNGSFATQIAYIAERGSGQQRSYHLVLADMDGGNKHELYRSQQPIVSPSWSANGKFLTFATYAQNQSQIILLDLSSGNRRVVVQTPHTSSAPALSPDGRLLAFVQSEQGNSEIYLLNLSNGQAQKLTNHPAIDTEPTFNSNGSAIYFTSDRNGKPQIFRMSTQGGQANLLAGDSFAASSNISPDGQFMALTRNPGGKSQIGIFDLHSNSFNALTNGRGDESASISPNGQIIVYATQEKGRGVLNFINHKGEKIQQITENGASLRAPAWAPDLRR